MQQLELRNESRYETQRQAQTSGVGRGARERQVLNRLREWPNGSDLNDRLKELQSALEEARTEQQKNCARQLQRLQDEQRQILQDTEELQLRMESAENLERMAEERQQLQETREQVQRASEALEQTQITQAAASGTRAEQNFEELRDEFRRRASGRFSEEMQQMRGSSRPRPARAGAVAAAAEAAQPQAQNQAKSLRDTGEREKIAEELTQQRQRLSGLEDQMRQTIQDAEQTEPLLAEKLYDAARAAQDQNVQRALEAAERSLRQGLTQDARQQEAPAARGISQLREGIDRAAEAVLGDETEALRRAAELQNLSRE
jgi:DNA repair ATPase RecN